MSVELADSLLGKKSSYIEHYDASLLFSLPRKINRDKLGIFEPLPFSGADIWNAFELSWLNNKGKPQVALAEFIFPCTSPNLVESKSFKLYLNSLNQTKFLSVDDVQKTLCHDLSQAAGSDIKIKMINCDKSKTPLKAEDQGNVIDYLDIDVDTYHVNPDFLKTGSHEVKETLISHLLKSNCLATGQPDWATVFVHYQGPKINREGLLKYIISYRRHQGFHEYCVERIFSDILEKCQPEKLTVYARYTRRGGLDINPFRSNFERVPTNKHLARQ